MAKSLSVDLRRRVGAAVPNGHWQTAALIGALRLSGIAAPMTPAKPEWRGFPGLCRAGAAPALRPGAIAITDNLPAQESPAIRWTLERTGAELRFSLPDSPDFNPIEMAFSKLETLRKKAAKRTVTALWDAIRDAIGAITTDDARGLFTATGYMNRNDGKTLQVRAALSIISRPFVPCGRPRRPILTPLFLNAALC